MKKIVYIDMDNVLVDFGSGIAKLDDITKSNYKGKLDEVPGIFSLMEPMSDAFKSVELLSMHFDLYVLTTAPWNNPSALVDKVGWIKKQFGGEKESLFYKRLIISHHKNLNLGHFLIDDRENNGAKQFTGEWVHFGSERFPDWKVVTAYLLKKIQL